MTAEFFIKAQLAAFAHREAAQHGGIDNMLAVCMVIRNRKYSGWCGGDWMNILYAASTQAATVYEATTPDLRDLNFRTLLQQVDDVYNGMAPDRMTEGALYYAELNLITNPWFQKNILQDPTHHPRVATVGNVSFFL